MSGFYAVKWVIFWLVLVEGKGDFRDQFQGGESPKIAEKTNGVDLGSMREEREYGKGEYRRSNKGNNEEEGDRDKGVRGKDGSK